MYIVGMVKLIISFALVLLVGMAHAREWRTAMGLVFTAELVGYEGGVVIFKTQVGNLEAYLDELHVKDREEIGVLVNKKGVIAQEDINELNSKQIIRPELFFSSTWPRLLAFPTYADTRERGKGPYQELGAASVPSSTNATSSGSTFSGYKPIEVDNPDRRNYRMKFSDESEAVSGLCSTLYVRPENNGRHKFIDRSKAMQILSTLNAPLSAVSLVWQQGIGSSKKIFPVRVFETSIYGSEKVKVRFHKVTKGLTSSDLAWELGIDGRMFGKEKEEQRAFAQSVLELTFSGAGYPAWVSCGMVRYFSNNFDFTQKGINMRALSVMKTPPAKIVLPSDFDSFMNAEASKISRLTDAELVFAEWMVMYFLHLGGEAEFKRFQKYLLNFANVKSGDSFAFEHRHALKVLTDGRKEKDLVNSIRDAFALWGVSLEKKY